MDIGDILLMTSEVWWYNPQKINIFSYVVLQKVIYVTWYDTWRQLYFLQFLTWYFIIAAEN